ncbi:MAG: Ig-like domain-containing protein, partial [Pseudomonadota bacterium]
ENPLDVGGDNDYNLTVQVTDGFNNVAQPILVTVTDVIENSLPVAVDDAENLDQGLGAGTFDVLANDFDPDPGDTLSLVSVSVDPAEGVASINFNNTVSFQPAPGFSGDAEIDYVIRDNLGATDSATLTVTVSQNFAPFISEPVSFEVPENEALNANLQAFDLDGDPITWSIAGGPDADLFSIDPMTGVLTFNENPDFENPLDVGSDNNYDLVVRASDPFGGTEAPILVTVTDVFEPGDNEAPVIQPIFGQNPDEDVTLFISEFSQGPIVTIEAIDPNSDTLEYQLFGEDAALFDLNPVTGVLSLIQPVPGITGSFDTDSIYELTVQVTDNRDPQELTDQVDLLLPLFTSA